MNPSLAFQGTSQFFRGERDMSYQKVPQEPYPPPGYGSTYPPPGYPSAPPAPGPLPPPQYEGYAPPPPPPAYPYPASPQPGYQGYFTQGYPAPPPPPQPYQVYHCDHYHYQDQSRCSSLVRGCLAALCCCCLLEECCF